MKTIEDEKKQEFDNFAISCALASAPIDEYKIPFKCGFGKGVEFAQRWIPVKEELPKIGHFVITKRSIGHELCFYNGNFWCNNIGIEIKNITHWRPIELK